VSGRDGDDVLRRMIAAAGGAGGVRPAMFPSRAMERAVIRTLHDEAGLVVESLGVTEARGNGATIAGDAGEGAMFLTLAGPEGARGIAALAAPLAAALVLRPLTGHAAGVGAAGRPFTRTDAAIVGPVIDRVLTAFAQALEGGEAAAWARGFAVDGHLGDPRLLGFWLPETVYRSFHLRLSSATAAAGAEGGLILALPAEPACPPGGRRGGGRPLFRARLGDRLMDSELPLDAVLARLSLPLPRVGALAVGTVLELPARALTSLRLEAAGGALVAEGRLGRLHGERALKITRLAGSPRAATAGPALTAREGKAHGQRHAAPAE